MADAAKPADQATAGHALREVRYQHSREFVPALERANVSLLVSTGQAGKLIAVGHGQGKLALSFHNFDRPMGIAAQAGRLAIGAREQVWMLRNAPELARDLPPAGVHDACYLTRSCWVTGEVHGHEISWVGDELWIVNTLFSCLASLDDNYSFVPRWRPPFISQLAPEDRCHLNGLAVEDGQPKYVTALARTDTPGGWRPQRVSDGCILDFPGGALVAQGLVMPHSPRVHDGRLLALDSGTGRLVNVDRATGKVDTICPLPGYTRGLACHGSLAFVGLSKIRETSTFGGLPIAEHREQLKCGVGIVDLQSGRTVAWLEFQSGVDEIFDVQVLPGTRRAAVVGPSPDVDGSGPIWLIPEAPPVLGKRPRAKATVASDWGPAAGLFNQGNACMDRTDWLGAEQAYRQVIALRPDAAIAHCNLGVALENQARFAAAADSFARALDYDVTLAEAHFNLSLVRLLLGEFASGWTDYEWRWQCAAFDDRPPLVDRLAPRWDGSPLAGRSLLVYGEQGVGDEVMFASCYDRPLAEAARCVLACDPRLVPLYARSFPKAHVCSLQALHDERHVGALGQFDLQIAAGSLPHHYRPTEASFPRVANYLQADPKRTEHWRSALRTGSAALKVGISWRGGKDTAEKSRRSIALDQWLPILCVPGVEFVNLQYGDHRAEIVALHERHGPRVLDFPEINPLHDLDEFAALLSALDLVISIDNSTVHFAGALGVPAWALVAYPSQSCWRWLLDRDDTVWYASVLLFRKMGATTWPDVVAEVAKHLQARATAQ